MTSALYIKSALAEAALDLMPPMIRNTLLDQRQFRDEYGFRTNAILNFDDSGVSFQRSNLFEAIQSLFSDGGTVDIPDTEGRNWKLIQENKADYLPLITIFSDDQRFILPDFSALSPDRDMRLRSLDEAAADVNLPAVSVQKWRDILSARALGHDEVDVFHRDFRLTPTHVARSIHTEIKEGGSVISSLIPSSRTYFERLVGAYDGSLAISDYAAGNGKRTVRELLAWRSYDGFLLSLLLSSHSTLTTGIEMEDLNTEDVVRAFDFLEKHGDRVSQVGAIEVGLRILPEKPEIEPFLIRLVRQIRDDDVEAPTSGFKLLSALFILVDGELARTRILSDTPPFYRRLASLSQAALIHRQLAHTRLHTERFCNWAYGARGEYFYFQSLADMRLEARWNPELSTASQIKADFFGRIMNAARNYEQNIANSALRDLIVGDEESSLFSLSELPRPYFPGPLEGGQSNPNALPADLTKAVEAQLAVEEVGPGSFIALVNSALIFRIETNHADLAAKALKLGSHRLKNIGDQSQLLAVLNGLATVAAVSNGETLADELRILVRRYRRDSKYAVSIDEALRVCLVAAASRLDPNAWREFIGGWITELAFDNLQDEEALTFHSRLQRLCHVAPELWVTCGRADAALAAFNAR